MKRILFVIMTLLFVGNTSAQFRKKSYRHIMTSKSIYEIDAFLRVAHEDDPRREVLKPRLIKMMKKYIRTAHPADPRIKEMQKKIALLKTRNSTIITFEEMSEEIKRRRIEAYKAKLQAKQKGTFANESNESEDNDNTSSVSSNNKTFTGAKQRNIHATSSRKRNTSTSSKTDRNTEKEFNRLMSRSDKNHEEKTVKLLNKLFENDPTSKETIVLIENKSDCNIIVTMEGAGGLKYKLPIPANDENSIVINKGSYLFTSKVCGATYASQKTVNKSLMISLKNPS